MMPLLRKIIWGLLAFLCINACTKIHSQCEFHSIGYLSSSDKIVLLSSLEINQDLDDEDVNSCLQPPMRDVIPGLNFIPAKQFRENLFPYFTSGATPHDVDGYKSILDKPEVQERINALGVRYLIILTKGRTYIDPHGSIFCGAGYGGGGCLGVSWWDRRSELEVDVWDLRNKGHAGSLQASAAGTGIMPAFGLPIPLYLPATKSAVCQTLGLNLAKWLSGQE